MVYTSVPAAGFTARWRSVPADFPQMYASRPLDGLEHAVNPPPVELMCALRVHLGMSIL
jgi:hypothetical protein